MSRKNQHYFLRTTRNPCSYPWLVWLARSHALGGSPPWTFHILNWSCAALDPILCDLVQDAERPMTVSTKSVDEWTSENLAYLFSAEALTFGKQARKLLNEIVRQRNQFEVRRALCCFSTFIEQGWLG